MVTEPWNYLNRWGKWGFKPRFMVILVGQTRFSSMKCEVFSHRVRRMRRFYPQVFGSIIIAFVVQSCPIYIPCDSSKMRPKWTQQQSESMRQYEVPRAQNAFPRSMRGCWRMTCTCWRRVRSRNIMTSQGWKIGASSGCRGIFFQDSVERRRGARRPWSSNVCCWDFTIFTIPSRNFGDYFLQFGWYKNGGKQSVKDLQFDAHYLLND